MNGPGKRKLNGGITATAGLCALAVGLAAIDPRVPAQIRSLLTGRGPSGELVSAGALIRDLGLVVVEAVRDQSIEHAPLTIFTLAALVLLLFMLRTSP
jgi:hypothetical protein